MGSMNEMELIDTHAHLEQLESSDEALVRAKDAGVSAVIAVGMDLASNRKILDLAARHPDIVRPALGAHPWAIIESEIDATVDFIESHIENCAAVGEIGLDYWIKQDKELQRKVFGKLLAIAARYEKPALTHSRGSYEDVLQMVKDSGVKRAVFHWYSGPVELAEEIAACGFHVSATPAVAYSEKHRAVIESVPLESLLLETDCPVKYNDIPSEPATVRVTLEEVARLKGREIELVAGITSKNARDLFGLSSREP